MSIICRLQFSQMSNDQGYSDQPPEFGDDTENSKENDAMFVSAIGSPTVDVELSGGEDDEEDPFGGPPPVRQKTPTETTHTVESSSNISQANNAPVVDEEEDDDPFGEKASKNNPPTSTPQPQTPTSKPSDSQLYANLTPSPVVSNTKTENTGQSDV